MTPRLLTAYAVHGAAIASPLPVLLFRRAEIASDLDLLGGIVGETAIIGLVAVVACFGMRRMRSAVPAGVALLLGAITATGGLALMAWTIEVGLFVAGGALLAIGVSPGLVLHRVILSCNDRPAARFRTMSLYWAAVAVGAGWPLAAQILWDPSYGTVLWVAAGLMALAALLLSPFALVHDADVETEPTARLLDVPWVRRSTGAAFGAGAAVVGGADAARALLAGEWQRSPEQTAAVLAAGVGAAVLVGLFGPWYHRLDRLTGARRADAIGTQLAVAGVAAVIGGLSFTYFGLIVAWIIAGGGLALAAAGLDAAVFPAVAPAQRRSVAARQVAALALGGLAATAFQALVIGSWSDQWKTALTGIPLVVAGLLIRRYADPARDAVASATAAEAAVVPRRITQNGGDVPLLSVEDLDVAYGSVQVLFGVDLTVDEGEIVALLGTNGAGKTTLLRAVSGLEPTIGGRVVYAGLDITRTRPTWRVGMGLHQVVGGDAVVPDLTVHENLRLFAYAVDHAERDDGIAEAYELFPRLRERQNQRAATLSGGEKQMLALAKPIIVPPRLLLIDEFSLGLAPLVIAELLPVVRRIADAGAAVLLVEQSVNIALSVADRAYVMEKGEIGYTGSAADLRGRPDLLRSAYLEGLAQALEG